MKNWSVAEQTVVASEISRSPTNLTRAFERSSKRLNDRTVSACSLQWYQVMRYQKKLFFIQNSGFKAANIKNDRRW